jgi:type I restriction enzyme M protein
MELEKLFWNTFERLQSLGFRADESFFNVLAFIIRKRIIATHLQNHLTTQILEEFHNHTNSRLLKELEEVLMSLDFSLISSKEFQDSFNFLVTKFFLNDSRSGQFFTPPSVTALAVDLVNPTPNQSIFDPTCGIGSFFVELNKRFPSYNLRFIGQEINAQTRFICLMNLFANEVFNAEIYLGNSLNNLELEEQGKIDIAIANPPFSLRLSIPNHRTSETAFIELMLSSTKNDGKAIIIVPESFLLSSSTMKFRRMLLENDLIETVISLPQDAFKPYAGVKTSIIVFNKRKPNKGFIIFDGKNDERFEETLISVDDILSTENVYLQVSRYALKEAKELKNTLSSFAKTQVRKIKDLVDKSVSGTNYSPKNRILEKSSETLPYVRIVDLSKSKTDFTLDISKIERKISHENVRSVIDFSAVLVNKIAPKLKPTYFDFTGQPIVIGSDIIALKMKAFVNVDYFFTQLDSRLVQIQVEMISSGTTINRITKEDFLNIQIILPTLAEQQRQILEMRGVIAEKVIAEEKLSIAKEELETTEYDVIAAIAHNLNQKLGQIVDDYGTLILFLQNKEKNQTPISFDEMLRPIRNGELMENVPKFSKVANRLQNNLLDTAYTMKTTENILQKSSIDIESVDIIRFFKESVKADFDNPHFTIKVESKLKSLIVLADRHALKDAFRNLIENAKKHGFTQSNRKYQIVFEISKYTDNSGDNFARIVYKNNGNPFPKSYRFEDYTRLGTRMGKNKGTGIGGFFVKKVLDLHKGSFKEITLHENNQETFQIQMEILLPLAD